MNPLTQEALETAKGLSGEWMLLFTFLVWAFFLTILLSSPRNRLNQWGFAGGMILSVGVLKEYLFYTLGPALIAAGQWTPAFSEGLYSVLSAVFYYCAMPTLMIFAFFFAHLEERRPAWFRVLRLAVYVPALIFFLVVPCTQTRAYQFSPAYCLSVGIYEYVFGILFTVVVVLTLYRERFSAGFTQRRMAAVYVLIPLWYWMISAFPWHVFGVTSLLKAWQGNLIVVAVLLVYGLYHAFREGIWGTRLRHESYDWTSGQYVLQRNAKYMNHALKGELAKIEWCVHLLRQRGEEGQELEIIQNAAQHLRQFAERTRLCSEKIFLSCALWPVEPLLREAAEVALPEGMDLSIQIIRCDSAPLYCDRTHFLEVLHNLLANAVDAVGSGGVITLSYQVFRDHARLAVRDNGRGISPEERRQLFDPYYTTKENHRNLGLGLYYCWNVMAAHKGRIQVESTPGSGSTFTLIFPRKRQA